MPRHTQGYGFSRAAPHRSCTSQQRPLFASGSSDRSSDMGSRVLPVKAASAVGAGSHAVPAADTAVVIHHHYAISPFECGLGRTDRDTGRILTVVAQGQNTAFLSSPAAHASTAPEKAPRKAEFQIHLTCLFTSVNRGTLWIRWQASMQSLQPSLSVQAFRSMTIAQLLPREADVTGPAGKAATPLTATGQARPTRPIVVSLTKSRLVIFTGSPLSGTL